MAAQIVMMYRIPKDAAAFDLHYFDIHVPLAQLLPGLRKYEIVQGASVLESPEYHLKETFHFDDAASAARAVCSPEGLAAAADRRLMAPRAGDVLEFFVDGYEFAVD